MAVTRAAGLVIASMKFIPKSAGEYIARKLGMDHVFIDDLDNAARKAYEDRARGTESLTANNPSSPAQHRLRKLAYHAPLSVRDTKRAPPGGRW